MFRSSLRSWPLLAVCAGWGVAVRPAEAQESRAPAASAADSLRTLRGARTAQSAFERLRFRTLPRKIELEGGGQCDERIGRFCFWYGDRDDDWDPPPEPESLREARERLIATLTTAAVAFPGDQWIRGQQARYLVEGGRTQEAIEAAEACRGTPWWCAALRGYALHAAGRTVDAEGAFDEALRAAPSAIGRSWNDLVPLLRPHEHSPYRRLSPARRDSANAAFWLWADPQLARPGNPVRTEHLSRHVTARLQERARGAEGIGWGYDLAEFLIRYGWPEGWERVRRRATELGFPHVVSHYANESWSLLPTLGRALEAFAPGPDAWEPEHPQPRTQHALPPFRAVAPLEHQIARFRRGDSAVFVARYTLAPDLAAESAAADSGVSAALVILPERPGRPAVGEQGGRGGGGTVRASTSETGRMITSLEVIADSGRRLERARIGVEVPPPTSGAALSDLLLLASPDSLPATLEDASARARGSVRVRSGERLGVFWEVYGLTAADSAVAVSVRVRGEGPGWTRRAAERLGLTSRRNGVRVGWTEETTGGPILARSLVVELPKLTPGIHTLILTVRPAGAEPVTSTRQVRVER